MKRYYNKYTLSQKLSYKKLKNDPWAGLVHLPIQYVAYKKFEIVNFILFFGFSLKSFDAWYYFLQFQFKYYFTATLKSKNKKF